MANHLFQFKERTFADSGYDTARFVKADTQAGLPTTGVTEGDLAYTLDNNTVWAWTGASWIALAGGGGGGNATQRDVAFVRPSGSSVDDDEFRDDTIAGAWTQTDAVTASVWTEQGDSMSCALPGGDPVGRLHALTRTLTGFGIGDSIQTALRLMNTAQTNPMAGLCLTDGVTVGAGVQIVAMTYWDTAQGWWGQQLQRMTNFTTAGTGTAVGTTRWSTPNLYQRIVYVAANTFRLDISPDGVSWITVVGNQAFTMTPTRGGFFASTWAGASPMIASFEHFRATV